MYVPLLAFVVLVAIPTVLYLSISKKKSPVTLGFILAGIHLAFFLYAAPWSWEGDSALVGWMWLCVIDLPISVPIMIYAWDLGPAARTVYFSVASFGVLGSVQYFLWGFLLGHLFGKRRGGRMMGSRTEKQQ